MESRELVQAARKLVENRGTLMHLLVNKPTPWLKPGYKNYVAPVYHDYYDVPAEFMDALEAALNPPGDLADALLMDVGQ